MLQRTLAFLHPHLTLYLCSLILMALGTAAALGAPWLTGRLFDTVIEGNGMQELWPLIGALAGLYAAQAVLGFFQSYLNGLVGQRVIIGLRERLFAAVQDLPIRRFTEGKTGELVSRLTSDIQLIQEMLVGGLATLIRHALMLVIGLGILFSMDWLLTALSLVVLPAIAVTATLLGRRVRKLSRSVQERVAEATAFMTEAIAGIRVLKSFTLEGLATRLFRERNQAVLTDVMRTTKVQVGLSSIIGFLGTSTFLFVAGFGGYRVIVGAISPGDLAAFFMYTQMIVGPIGTLADLYGNMQRTLAASDRLFEILDAPPETAAVRQPPQTLPKSVTGAVRFEHVWFSYSDGDPVLHDIDLTVEPGETVALVGPSGAGKSTLINLLLAYDHPQKGRICIDGVDIRNVEPRVLRKHIGIVPQETFLFGRSIRENIACGRPNATFGDIVTAAKMANAHDFILRTESGYDTPVGEGGVRLSGGQRQRIAIARVLLKNPPILLLDEATSALDTASERSVQEALDRLRRHRTTLVVAHRLSTVRQADRIVVLDRGRIVEVGSHAELNSREGLYAQLYRLQLSEDTTNSAKISSRLTP